MSTRWPEDRQSLSWTLESSSLLPLEGTYRLAPGVLALVYEKPSLLAVPMIRMLKPGGTQVDRRRVEKDLKKVEG